MITDGIFTQIILTLEGNKFNASFSSLSKMRMSATKHRDGVAKRDDIWLCYGCCIVAARDHLLKRDLFAL